MKHKFTKKRIKEIIRDELEKNQLKEAMEYSVDPSVSGFESSIDVERELTEVIEDYFEDNGILIDKETNCAIGEAAASIIKVVEKTSERIRDEDRQATRFT
jgi:hypothetical protein